MVTFAANISILFPRLPFLDRIPAARAAGFDAIEFWWPAASELEDRSLDDLVAAIRQSSLQVGLINFDAGDMRGGDRGLAADPHRSGDFRANIPVAIDLARRLGCRKLNALAGNARDDGSRSGQREELVRNLRLAADAAHVAGMSVMLEALNPKDTPKYLLPNADIALQLIKEVARPNVRYQLDTYHVAMAGDDIIEVLGRVAPVLGHVQIADAPGRHEPGTGVLALNTFLASLLEVGYEDYVGLEYQPTDPEHPDFAYLPRLTRWNATHTQEVSL